MTSTGCLTSIASFDECNGAAGADLCADDSKLAALVTSATNPTLILDNGEWILFKMDSDQEQENLTWREAFRREYQNRLDDEFVLIEAAVATQVPEPSQALLGAAALATLLRLARRRGRHRI
jgi:hypothetical protein